MEGPKLDCIALGLKDCQRYDGPTTCDITWIWDEPTAERYIRVCNKEGTWMECLNRCLMMPVDGQE